MALCLVITEQWNKEASLYRKQHQRVLCPSPPLWNLWLLCSNQGHCLSERIKGVMAYRVRWRAVPGLTG